MFKHTLAAGALGAVLFAVPAVAETAGDTPGRFCMRIPVEKYARAFASFMGVRVGPESPANGETVSLAGIFGLPKKFTLVEVERC
ncbi:hypothetical protein ABZ897_39210 [Nonomuraea sp. NPDC046802]|uniref:hypothetical protein n=1 Tax=Nonomuraea sp. NPDC046802 TaxID=3154919 RepID=UPI0033F18085